MGTDERVDASIDRVPGGLASVRALLCVPFDEASYDALLGVCEVFNKSGAPGGAFPEEDAVTLTKVLRTFAMAVENITLKGECERLRAMSRRR